MDGTGFRATLAGGVISDDFKLDSGRRNCFRGMHFYPKDGTIIGLKKFPKGRA